MLPPGPRAVIPMTASPFLLLHPEESDVEALLKRGLEIDALQGLSPGIVGHRVGGTRIPGVTQLDEHSSDLAFSGRFGPGNVDRVWIEVRGLDLPVLGDLFDLQDVASVGPDPSTLERLRPRPGLARTARRGVRSRRTEPQESAESGHAEHQDQPEHPAPAAPALRSLCAAATLSLY